MAAVGCVVGLDLQRKSGKKIKCFIFLILVKLLNID